MAARTQATAWINRLATIERGDMLINQLWSFARTAQTEALVEHQLRRRHRVMQLDSIEILWPDAGFFISCISTGGGRVRTVVARQAIYAGLQYTACDSDQRLARKARGHVGRADHRCSGAVGDRRAHQQRQWIDDNTRLHDFLDC